VCMMECRGSEGRERGVKEWCGSVECGRNMWQESETRRCSQCNAKNRGKWY
jgi:hypothetical protein